MLGVTRCGLNVVVSQWLSLLMVLKLQIWRLLPVNCMLHHCHVVLLQLDGHSSGTHGSVDAPHMAGDTSGQHHISCKTTTPFTCPAAGVVTGTCQRSAFVDSP